MLKRLLHGLNGEISSVWNPVTQRRHELSSTGVRVVKDTTSNNFRLGLEKDHGAALPSNDMNDQVHCWWGQWFQSRFGTCFATESCTLGSARCTCGQGAYGFAHATTILLRWLPLASSLLPSPLFSTSLLPGMPPSWRAWSS